ncbi:MAG: 16S rRNA processing protein RimM [Alphaproteobacteria bacterium]|nr:16S rRNA processing protein RimM [Alphaproteobacteria bacterium]
MGGKSQLILAGKFGAPHGVRGEIRLRSFTADPLAIAGYGALVDSTGQRKFRIESARPVKNDMLVVRVTGIHNRNEAETLTNLDVFADRSALPPPGNDEFYLADLEGLEARLADGSHFGRVTRIENYGAGDILIITRPDNSEEMISFIEINVPEVNPAGGYLVVSPPASIDARGDFEPQA